MQNKKKFHSPLKQKWYRSIRKEITYRGGGGRHQTEQSQLNKRLLSTNTVIKSRITSIYRKLVFYPNHTDDPG